jgi:hypothetical protein
MTPAPPPTAVPSDREIAERIVASLLDRVGKAIRAHENGQKNLCAEYLADLMLEPARIAASAERALSAARREARAASIKVCIHVQCRHCRNGLTPTLINRRLLHKGVENANFRGLVDEPCDAHFLRALLPDPAPTKET